MLKKVNRLRRKKDIEKILRKGEGFKENFLILKVLKNNSNKIRFSFIVSKKVSKKATLRNKIKRRLRELVRLKIQKIKKGVGALLIALPGLETKDFWEIEEAVNKLFEKAKIINK